MTLPPLVVPPDPDTEPRASFYCDECTQETFPPYPHKFAGAWHMPASGGGFYELLLNEMGGWTCSCPGFHFRCRCRHIFGTVDTPGVYALDRDLTKKKVHRVVERSGTKLGDIF